MKKLLTIATVAACTSFAMSASAILFSQTGGNAVPADDTGNSYVTTGFSMPTSTGVELHYAQNATIMAVGASNAKGSDPTIGFGGSTNGGVIATCGNAFDQPTPVLVAPQAGSETGGVTTPPSAQRAIGC